MDKIICPKEFEHQRKMHYRYKKENESLKSLLREAATQLDREHPKTEAEDLSEDSKHYVGVRCCSEPHCYIDDQCWHCKKAEEIIAKIKEVTDENTTA